MNNNNFWHGKRVLITGGDGFVASNLAIKLSQEGAVVVLIMRHHRPILTIDLVGASDEVKSAIYIEQTNLLDLSALRRICDRHQVDTIFHLAASVIVSDAANSPYSTIENNIIGTLNILEVARINKISRVLSVSTDKSYGDHLNDTSEPLPYKENYALRGLDVYSSSKVCSDMLAQTYSYQYKVPVLVARACNIYGVGDLNFSRLIPKTIMCLLSKKSPIINAGNSSVLREYIYVSDVVDAYLLLMEKVGDYYGKNNCNMPKNGKETYGWASFNVGTCAKLDHNNEKKLDNVKSVVEVIGLLQNRIENIDSVEREKALNFIEIPDQYLDSTKINNLGFKSKVSFEEGLEKTVKWYQDNYDYLIRLAHKYIQ
ncbi:MAG: hypothetical protein COY69_00050 [Candidatus Magasanikbacteria bacterium CG_4_10_14_0_8_um_filter_32_14]|uniref:NAD(P)-binding domain-containing protein n=2 Tax=Candidatus Magasanikiibacteriota TaxID=1752731 RepID=A0A2M7RAF4_9BACT|nr:MAG: hypothetical protein AUJ23_01115 [Candidatus Magasanikbacteria bacterium CG1_02_32_51]PIY93743.1 MAG: hypothetical protein COY69_00050 [Candidatus Magasanikbacteria bacterium CG_4_10_14_0_8_um_filter_32_14]